MPAPFGFSVGDFIAGVTLIKDCLQALNDTRGSSSQYLELIEELRSLESCLVQVKALYGETDQPVQRMALENAVTACEQAIDHCLAGVTKYHSHLSVTGTRSRVRDGWRKIQWQFAKPKELAAFRHSLATHVHSMQTLIATIQLSSMSLDRKKAMERDNQNQRQVDVMASMHHSVEAINTSFAGLRRDLLGQATTGERSPATIDTIQQLMISHHLHMVSKFDELAKLIPAQVLLHEPKVFIDALGRRFLIHLDFIDSWEIFLAVLEIRFHNLGRSKVQRKEFTLRDSRTRRPLSMRSDFLLCMSPVQEFDMSVIFNDISRVTSNRCPRCFMGVPGDLEQEIECPNCQCVFQRVVEEPDDIHRDSPQPSGTARASTSPSRSETSDEKDETTVRPCDFKRLRLMYNKTLPRPPGSKGCTLDGRIAFIGETLQTPSEMLDGADCPPGDDPELFKEWLASLSTSLRVDDVWEMSCQVCHSEELGLRWYCEECDGPGINTCQACREQGLHCSNPLHNIWYVFLTP